MEYLGENTDAYKSYLRDQVQGRPCGVAILVRMFRVLNKRRPTSWLQPLRPCWTWTAH